MTYFVRVLISYLLIRRCTRHHRDLINGTIRNEVTTINCFLMQEDLQDLFFFQKVGVYSNETLVYLNINLRTSNMRRYKLYISNNVFFI